MGYTHAQSIAQYLKQKTCQTQKIEPQWHPDAATGYWRQFVERTDAVKRHLDQDPEWVVWMSLGINDAIAGTDPDTWQQQVGEHLGRIQQQLPGARVVMTEFQSMGYPETNRRIRRLADEVASSARPSMI